jgi:predicted DsbA family dithiol-disulfide isomerase
MRLRAVWPLAVALGVLPSSFVGGEDGPAVGGNNPTSAETPVAIVAGKPITAGALEVAIGGPLLELRAREYQLRSQTLDDLIARALLEREAEARGVSVDALEKAEIEGKTAVSEADAKAFYDANKTRFGSTPEADALKQIRTGLTQQRENARRAAFARELRSRYAVKVLLEPYRVPIEVGDAPARGKETAPVTIVEFSDFQCPFCARARPAVNRVREVYGDKVRFAFRHFPLNFHPQAEKAGEAVACAREQGRFWEMHDRLWANPGKLQPAELKEHAAAIGLDAAAFGQCLDSGRYAGLVRKDVELGARYGVSGTPAFFVNGRPLVGAQPFESFAQVIDDELQRLGVPAPAAAESR